MRGNRHLNESSGQRIMESRCSVRRVIEAPMIQRFVLVQWDAHLLSSEMDEQHL